MYNVDLALNSLQWFICHKTKPNPTQPNILYLIYMYKVELALNSLQWFICHKTKPNQTKPNQISEFQNRSLVVYAVVIRQKMIIFLLTFKDKNGGIYLSAQPFFFFFYLFFFLLPFLLIDLFLEFTRFYSD